MATSVPIRALLSVGVAVVAVGCPKDEGGGDGGAPAIVECETRDDCTAGLVCTQEKRCANCDSSGECRLKEECSTESLTCQLRSGWGTDCVLNGECQAGEWCRQGLCADRALVNLCPGNVSSECPQGFRCNTLNSVCEEDLGCAEDADCSTSEVCNTGTHGCVPRCTAETQGAICAGGEKCARGMCVQCESSGECGVGLVCDLAGRCVSEGRCYQDRDCKVPLVCFQQTGTCVVKPPPCVSDESCSEEQRCDLPTGKCVPRACQADRLEPNDDPAHAYAVTASKYVGLTLCKGDLDTFSLSLARGDQVGVNVDADPFSEGTFSTVIRDSSGRVVSVGRLLASYVAPVAGTYVVVVSSSDPFQLYGVAFLLSRGVPCDDDGFEPNDLLAQATPLNTATTASGAICPQDRDYFTVAAPAGKGLVASLEDYNSASGLLRLCVLSSGVEVGCSEDLVAPSVSVSLPDAGSGAFAVVVSGASERVANTYTLRVSFP